MSLVRDLKSSFTIIVFIIFAIFIFLLPWSIFVHLPAELWFLQNKSLAEYVGEHVQLILYLVLLVCLVTLPVIILKGKKR